MKKNDLETRTLTIKREFDCNRDDVWKAWTNPTHLKHWWAPTGIPFEVVKHELVEGGNWEYHMKLPDGNDFISRGKFITLENNKLLVSSASFLPMTKNIEMEVLLISDQKKTTLIFKVIHESEQYCKSQETLGFFTGWNVTFDRLSAYLSTF